MEPKRRSTTIQRTLEERIWAAYLRTRWGWTSLNPLAHGVLRHAEVDGLKYVILSSPDARIVAVYRVKQDGGLKRLRRWPKDLA